MEIQLPPMGWKSQPRFSQDGNASPDFPWTIPLGWKPPPSPSRPHVLPTFHTLFHKHVPVELGQLVPVGERHRRVIWGALGDPSLLPRTPKAFPAFQPCQVMAPNGSEGGTAGPGLLIVLFPLVAAQIFAPGSSQIFAFPAPKIPVCICAVPAL